MRAGRMNGRTETRAGCVDESKGAIIQIGTELAVILYFRHDIIRILGAWFCSLFGKEGKDFKSRMAWTP